MECTLQVGDKCVCIHEIELAPGERFISGIIRPVIGETYTVREVCISPAGDISIKLVEIVNAHCHFIDASGECMWKASRFRPIQQIDTTATVAALAQAMREAMKKGRVDA